MFLGYLSNCNWDKNGGLRKKIGLRLLQSPSIWVATIQLLRCPPWRAGNQPGSCFEGFELSVFRRVEQSPWICTFPSVEQHTKNYGNHHFCWVNQLFHTISMIIFNSHEYVKVYQGVYEHILVGGWATPLKNMSSSVGMMKATQYFWENSKFMATKPPTRWHWF